MNVSVRHGLLVLAIRLSPALALAQTAITIDPTLPSDIAGGAASATLQQSAAFAWQEFIALNWPALAGQRDTPGPGQKFGAAVSGPLVWQTFRGKVEIFNLTTADSPPGYTPDGPGYGYNTPTPAYIYRTREIAACPGQTAPASPAWINLDETTQIALARMFAGGPAIA
jgi:hypothetical protein